MVVEHIEECFQCFSGSLYTLVHTLMALSAMSSLVRSALAFAFASADTRSSSATRRSAASTLEWLGAYFWK